MLDVAHVAQQTVAFIHHLVTTAPSPDPASTGAPKPSASGDNLAGMAALIASITGLVTAIGAIFIGLRKRDSGSAAADKAIEYLIKQNKELLKDRGPEQPRKRP